MGKLGLTVIDLDNRSGKLAIDEEPAWTEIITLQLVHMCTVHMEQRRTSGGDLQRKQERHEYTSSRAGGKRSKPTHNRRATRDALQSPKSTRASVAGHRRPSRARGATRSTCSSRRASPEVVAKVPNKEEHGSGRGRYSCRKCRLRLQSLRLARSRRGDRLGRAGVEKDGREEVGRRRLDEACR